MTTLGLIRLIALAWQNGVDSVALELLRVLSTGESLRQDVVDAILKGIDNRTGRITELMAENVFMKVVRGNSPDTRPLMQMVEERTAYWRSQLQIFRKDVTNSGQDLLILGQEIRKGVFPEIFIGRRREDIIRNLTLDTLEKTFIKGEGNAAAIPELVKKIKETTPILTEDGARLILPIRTRDATGRLVYQGATRAYQPQVYAEMAATTAAREADTLAQIERADELETRFLQYNDTGRSKADYEAHGDTFCAKVNGAIVTTVPGGVGDIPYIKDLLPDGFNTPHPHCKHKPRPIPERMVARRLAA